MNYYDINKAEAELLIRVHEKAKSPAVKSIELKNPSNDKSIQNSNMLVLALKENRILLFSVLLSWFFFITSRSGLIGAAVYIVFTLCLSIMHSVFKNTKADNYILLFLAAYSYGLAFCCTRLAAVF